MKPSSAFAPLFRSWFGLEYHRRELPARADGLATLWQIGHVDHGPVWRGLRLWSPDTGGIDAQPHPFSVGWLHQIARKHPAQPPLVNPSIFKGFIQTTPAPFKPRRERLLRKRVGIRLSQEGIHRIEQRVCCSLKTPVDLVTKVVQCVKVHLGNAPVFKLVEHYSFGQSFTRSSVVTSMSVLRPIPVSGALISIL